MLLSLWGSTLVRNRTKTRTKGRIKIRTLMQDSRMLFLDSTVVVVAKVVATVDQEKVADQDKVVLMVQTDASRCRTTTRSQPRAP